MGKMWVDMSDAAYAMQQLSRETEEILVGMQQTLSDKTDAYYRERKENIWSFTTKEVLLAMAGVAASSFGYSKESVESLHKLGAQGLKAWSETNNLDLDSTKQRIDTLFDAVRRQLGGVNEQKQGFQEVTRKADQHRTKISGG